MPSRRRGGPNKKRNPICPEKRRKSGRLAGDLVAIQNGKKKETNCRQLNGTTRGGRRARNERRVRVLESRKRKKSSTKLRLKT